MGYAHHIVVEVLNIRELAAYYGETGAWDVMQQLHRRTQQLCGMSVVTACREPGRIRIGRDDRRTSRHTEAAVDDGHWDAGHLDQLLALLSQPQADFPLLTSLAVLVAQWAHHADGGGTHAPSTSITRREATSACVASPSKMDTHSASSVALCVPIR